MAASKHASTCGLCGTASVVTHTRIISASASYYNHHGYLLGLPGDENVVKKPNNIHALHTDH
jgi:hypothetical protein